MPDTAYLFAAVAVSAGITWALRALPFAVLAPLRASRTMRFLSTRMPAGVMVILLVYCLREVSWNSTSALAPLLALAVTAGLHLWRRNALLSILGGTTAHVLLASLVFSP
ncbi:branched-chain amino acid transporter permease [Prauserella cavernicola]|uniref:AzlD domain-containing protein n=1 Tax=Prauserella cavernicola TaxID=2800127 RepID=A0A934QVE2_9PSEU|nr:AzlD domain-containing protein [Prauserella cavernicola]MBK1787083.1 AzlD domain-containing protein [Prauserella cavernicola]